MSLQSGLNVVVVKSGVLQYGLVVGELKGAAEVVAKPKGNGGTNGKEFSGTAIMGDGYVAFIIDPAGLAAKAGL